MVAASSTGGLVYSTLDGSFMSAPPAPRPMAANPYLAPSTAAQLTSILMEVASLKAKVADKESEAILNTMQFMLEDARNRIAINHDKADAEKLAAAAKIVAATMSIVGGLVSLGGAMAAERSYQAEKKKPGDAAEVSDVSDGSAAADASRKGAESTSKQRAARDADLDARRADHADADAARVRTESGRGVMGGVATARADDRGELTVTVGDGPSSRTGTLSATPDRPAVEPDGASKTKPIDGAGEAKETKGEAWDKDEALNRRTERKEFAEFLGDKVIGKTGEIVAQGMTIASIDQRSEAERNEIVSQTYGELTRMVQQQIVGDQQNVNNEFKEILALAKELMQKETDQLAQLFQMRM